MPLAKVAKATFTTFSVAKVAFATSWRAARDVRTGSKSVKASFPTFKVGKEAFTDLTHA